MPLASLCALLSLTVSLHFWLYPFSLCSPWFLTCPPIYNRDPLALIVPSNFVHEPLFITMPLYFWWCTTPFLTDPPILNAPIFLTVPLCLSISDHVLFPLLVPPSLTMPLSLNRAFISQSMYPLSLLDPHLSLSLSISPSGSFPEINSSSIINALVINNLLFSKQPLCL